MNIFHTITLAIIEGITEFLPISSTGHMILASHLLQIKQDELLKTFEIAIQIGPIAAISLLYFKKILKQKELFYKACTGFIPTGILGLILYPKIKGLLGSEIVPVISLFIGGIVIIGLEMYFKQKSGNGKLETENIKKLSYKQALIIGLIQSVSMIPGVSRSAASIFGGLFLKLDRKSAVEFSFLLAIPTMMAATSLDIIKSAHTFTQSGIFYIIFGTVLSFLVALFVVKWLLRYVQTHNFMWFGVYRIVFAIIYFLLFIK
jgi:undecaprenyl-diphosphatase